MEIDGVSGPSGNLHFSVPLLVVESKLLEATVFGVAPQLVESIVIGSFAPAGSLTE
jgi:hypothetical protein